MNETHYAVACGMAGGWVGSNAPVRFALTRGIPNALLEAHTAVYITQTKDVGTAHVVGSVQRG